MCPLEGCLCFSGWTVKKNELSGFYKRGHEVERGMQLEVVLQQVKEEVVVDPTVFYHSVMQKGKNSENPCSLVSCLTESVSRQ